MIADDPRVVAKAVQDRLRKSPVGMRLRVLADEIRRETTDGVWWYVPVSIHRDPEHMGEIYDALSIAEEHLEEEDHVTVLLVPRILPFAAWQDIA